MYYCAMISYPCIRRLVDNWLSMENGEGEDRKGAIATPLSTFLHYYCYTFTKSSTTTTTALLYFKRPLFYLSSLPLPLPLRRRCLRCHRHHLTAITAITANAAVSSLPLLIRNVAAITLFLLLAVHSLVYKSLACIADSFSPIALSHFFHSSNQMRAYARVHASHSSLRATT